MAPARTTAVLSTAAAAAMAAGGLLLLRTFDPNAPGNPFPGCAFHALTGLYCVGCGMTRAMYALAHGDLPQALAMNPLLVLLLGLVPLLLAWQWGWKPAWMRGLIGWLLKPQLWLILLPGYWLARNLPWWPFYLLAPG